MPITTIEELKTGDALCATTIHTNSDGKGSLGRGHKGITMSCLVCGCGGWSSGQLVQPTWKLELIRLKLFEYLISL